MTGRPAVARLLALAILVLGVVISAVVVAAGAVAPATQVASQLNVAAFLLTGLLLVERLPGHRVSQLLFGFGVGSGVLSLGDAYVRLPGPPPGAPLVAALFNHGELLLFPLLAGLFLVFPDGRLLSWRWAVVLAFVTTGACVAFVALAVQPGTLSYFSTFDNILGIEGAPGRLIGEPAYALVGIGLAASASALVVRWQRGGPVVRAQLKWVALSATAVGITMAARLVTSGISVVDGGLWSTVVVVLSLLLPVSIGIAILRYRLYEIDRIVSRTIGWAVVTGLLLAVFAGTIVGLQTLLTSFTTSNTLAVAGSTLVAAALFQPLRARVQRAVDRRFNRSRVDAQRAVDDFGGHLRDEVDLVAVRGRLLAAVDAAVQPAGAGVWLR